jgi:hypothetical protein
MAGPLPAAGAALGLSEQAGHGGLADLVALFDRQPVQRPQSRQRRRPASDRSTRTRSPAPKTFHEHRTEHPLLPPALLRHRRFNAANCVSFSV